MVAGPPDISGLLAAWSDGEQEALNCLMPLVYAELRRVARKRLGRQASQHSLESAALANEAYLRLVRGHAVHCENRLQFFALCAQIIRSIVVDHARKRRYAKRGGSAVRIPLDEEVVLPSTRGVELLALDDALASLAKIDPRKGKLVELHYFGGLTVEESAQVLRISRETAKRDWKMAKAWLLRELTGTPGNASLHRHARE
jgi:RNA polymerase sigma factor (TIGR02999 family)